jgi:DNA-binding protein HU-beta
VKKRSIAYYLYNFIIILCEGANVNRKDIVNILLKKRPSDYKSRAAAERTVKAVFDTIAESLINGDDVMISNFGSFKKVHKEERIVYNPRTLNEVITVPAHDAIRLKTSKYLREQMNR